MSQQRQGRPIPLLLRKIIFRLLIMGALISIVACLARCLPLIQDDAESVHSLVGYILPPFAIFVHHTYCLWPRKYWPNICELLLLTIETGGMIAWKRLIMPFTLGQYQASAAAPFFMTAFSDVLIFCVTFSLLFMVWDLANSKGRNICEVYDILSNYGPIKLKERRLGMIIGTYAYREQLDIDNAIVQLVRGWLASLFFIVVIMAALYVLIAQPTQQRSFTSIKTLLVSPGSVFYPPSPSLRVVALVRSRLEHPELTSDHLPAFLKVTFLSQDSNASPTRPFSNCSYGSEEMSKAIRVTFSCSSPPSAEESLSKLNLSLPDLLISVDYKVLGFNGTFDPSNSTYDRSVLIFLGLTNSIEDVITNTYPTPLLPGSRLYASMSLSLRDRPKANNPGAIIFGLPSPRYLFFLANLYPVIPDPHPLNPQDNTTATLQVVHSHTPNEWKLEQDHSEQSVVDGLALVGGFWTFINGTFTAIFGSTLLFVLFGIKPLSIYGLIHIFRRPKCEGSPQDITLSSREQARFVASLRKHLVDIDDMRLSDHDLGSSSETLPQSKTPGPSKHSEELIKEHEGNKP